jgi:hypothetical protein
MNFPIQKASQWCLKQFDTKTMNIMRKQGKRVVSLRPEDIDSRYHLPTPTCSLNELFLKGFSHVRKGPTNKMKNWWVDEDETLKQGHKLFLTHRLHTPYKMLVAMICRLYGEEKCTHFQTDWLPLTQTIVRIGKIFN